MPGYADAPSLTASQSAAVTADGQIFVDAGPGTGKTHVIVSRLRHLIANGVDPARMLVLTFSRRAAGELRERITRDTGLTVDVRTFHGFASRLLEADGPRFKSRRLLDAFTEALLVDVALARTRFTMLAERATSSEGFRADFKRFFADLRRSDAAAVRALRVNATPCLRDLLAACDTLVALLDDVSASDLDDLVSRAVGALADETSAPAAWLAGRYEHVLIDEFQDIDPMQLELVAKLGATLFAVGDASQAIYAFRGALAGVIDTAVERFKMQRFVLDESRRCPQIVCDLASKTPFVDAKALVSAGSVPGSVTVRVARTTLDEAALIADRVEDALVDGVAPEKIGVLLRSMRPLGPALEAELRARNVSVAGGGRGAFLGHAHVETLRLGLRLLAAPREIDRWMAFLALADIGFEPLVARTALTRLRIQTLDEGLEALAGANGVDARAVDALAATLTSAAEAFDANDIGRAARRLINNLGLARGAMNDPLGVSTARLAIGRLGRVVDALSGAQRNLGRLGEPCTSDVVLAEFENRIESIAAEEVPPDDVPGVRVLTVHGAKGLEFDLVVVGDAVEGRFPTAGRRSPLFDSASLEAIERSDVDFVDAREGAGLREEAALWYVAVTRTRDALLITCATQGGDGTPQRPSRFLPNAYHPKENEIPFERRLDRFEDLVRESGDAAAIANVQASLEGSPARRAVLNQGAAAFAALPQRPLVYERTPSVSGAETWLACPRRFYYSHILGLSDEPGLSAEVGSALHAVLAAFHETHRDFLREFSMTEVSEWTRQLQGLRESEWDKRAFATGAYREASARFADRALAAYAVSLADEAAKNPFTVVACERKVESVYGSGALTGRIDRVDELQDGTLVLRDYKAGRMNEPLSQLLEKETKDSAPIPGDVDSHFRPQLTLYRRGAEAEFAKTVSRLDYVYLNGIKNNETKAIGLDAFPIDATTEPRLAVLDELFEREFVDAFRIGADVPIPVAAEVSTCLFCAFERICPGPTL